MSLSAELKSRLLSKGASLVGFADLKDIPAAYRDNKKYGISIAVALEPSIVHGIAEGPTQEYYAAYKSLNEQLDNLVLFTGDFLKGMGYEAVMKTTTEVVIDDHAIGTVLPHKTIATRAGLGWIGKCALLVTENFGSAIRISSVLTDAPLEVGKAINESRCGSCHNCVEACPGKAPMGINWELGKPREEFFNAFECRKAAREKAALVGIDGTLCGKCIEICPWTQRYLRRI